MRKIFYLTAIAFSVSIISFMGCASMSSKNLNSEVIPGKRIVPEVGQTLVFAGQNNYDSSLFVKINKRIPYGFMIYTSLANLEGLTENANPGAGDTSAAYIMKNYPGTALQIGLYLVNSLEAIIDGHLDDNIEKFANWIKSTQVPVYLRIGYEFDYPENGYDPDLYIAAYKKIVDKFRELGVTNVEYVWHSYAALNPKGIESWYPGDEYVDWCAISYFATPQWIPMVNFAKRNSKPLMIAECSPILGDFKNPSKLLEWYKKLFRFIENQNVKAFCYINADWDSQPMFAHFNWGSGRLNQSKEIQNFWLETISAERFIFQK